MNKVKRILERTRKTLFPRKGDQVVEIDNVYPVSTDSHSSFSRGFVPFLCKFKCLLCKTFPCKIEITQEFIGYESGGRWEAVKGKVFCSNCRQKADIVIQEMRGMGGKRELVAIGFEAKRL